MEASILAYLQTVKDEALSDIEDAVMRFRRGEVPGVDDAFCPTGPQFYKEVRFQGRVRLIRERREENVVSLPQTKSKFLQNYETRKKEG